MKTMTYREALKEALIEEMRLDSSVYLLGEDLADPMGGSLKVTLGISTEFGTERVRNTPISETAILGCAIGSATQGLRPVAEIMYLDFTTVCMDMIVNQAAKIHFMSGGQINVPMVIRTQGGAGRNAGAQHSQSLEAWFMHVPGLKVVTPSCPADAKGLLKTAIRDDNPVLFIENCQLYNIKGDVPDGEYTIPFGKANVKREGSDVTIVSYWRMVNDCLKAAETLEMEGIST
ncbi:MAG: transketolase C-terminal domain-containing protein, partial [Sedimentibacter sp.]